MNTQSFYSVVGGRNTLSGLLLMTCLWMFSLSMQAQTAAQRSTVKGVLKDSITRETIPFATIRITAGTQTKPVAMGVSDAEGRFNLTVAAKGPVVALFSSVGKTVAKKSFTLNAGTTTIDLGTVLMHDTPEALKGVDVVALKPLVTAAPDKLTYDMASDPETPASNVLDMLRKVPLVAVDGQDNITVKGSSNFKIYVNGKPNPMFSSNAKNILKTLPASTIQKVEVITDLGAKYDAEGTAGVINLVMQTAQSSTNGFVATLSANAGNRGMGGGINTTVQAGKLMVNANYNYSDVKSPENKITSVRENYNSQAGRILKDVFSNKNTNTGMHIGSLNASYEFSPRSLLTLGAQVFSVSNLMNNTGTTEVFTANGNKASAYRMTATQKMQSSRANVNADYQYNLNEKGQMLTFSYNLSMLPTKTDYLNKYAAELEGTQVPLDYAQNMDADFTEHTLQADYVNPFNAHHYMDMGLKYIQRNNQSEAVSTLLNNEKPTADTDNSGTYHNKYGIMAAYADYRYTLGAFSARGGVRFEHSRMSTTGNNTQTASFSKNYNDVVPGLTFTYLPKPTQTLKLSYNLRIARPSINMLNPFVNRDVIMSIEYGNPNLETEKYHTFDLSYGSFGSKLSYNLSLGYETVNNGIERYTQVNENTWETTYGNVVKANNMRTNLWFNYNPWKLTRIMVSANAAYKDMRSRVLNRHLGGWEYSVFGNIQQQIGQHFTATVFAVNSRQQVNFNQVFSPVWIYGASVTAALLKDKRLNISLQAVNPFEHYTHMKIWSKAPEYRSDTHLDLNIRSWTLTVSYRIGDLKSQIKKVQRSIENNDLKSAEKAQPGEGM